jgi:aminoglycoside/choline kinase family phosphotransferase
MEDLGATWLLEHLNQLSANDVLFEKLKPAFDVLMTMQKNGQAVATQLPFYDEALLLKEMRLMPEWFLKTHCGLCLSESEEHLMSSAFEKIVAQLMTQPKGLVHRDFHSRNLMVLDNHRLGVIDFQDAVYGPLSYDWISILKDCYICFPRQQVTQWIAHYHAIWQAHGLLTGLSAHAWLRCCDWMGLQRHIKVLGIFARLHHRDHKSQYLGDLPRVFAYVDEALLLLPELTEFKEWWHARVRPTFERMAQ